MEEQPIYAEAKNRIVATKDGNVVQAMITATSEEMADKIFDLFELFATTVGRIDLEKEWRK